MHAAWRPDERCQVKMAQVLDVVRYKKASGRAVTFPSLDRIVRGPATCSISNLVRRGCELCDHHKSFVKTFLSEIGCSPGAYYNLDPLAPCGSHRRALPGTPWNQRDCCCKTAQVPREEHTYKLPGVSRTESHAQTDPVDKNLNNSLGLLRQAT